MSYFFPTIFNKSKFLGGSNLMQILCTFWYNFQGSFRSSFALFGLEDWRFCLGENHLGLAEVLNVRYQHTIPGETFFFTPWEMIQFDSYFVQMGWNIPQTRNIQKCTLLLIHTSTHTCNTKNSTLQIHTSRFMDSRMSNTHLYIRMHIHRS